jgi:DNA-binding SARP family transcriptional activator
LAVGERHIAPAAPKFRQVLALLAFRAGEVVPVRTLIDELWPDNPPRTATTTTQSYIYGLRKIVNSLANTELGKATIVTHRPGYVLRLSRDHVDVHRLRISLAQAREVMAAEPAKAGGILRRALARAPTMLLADLPLGPVLTTYADELREEVLAARQQYIAIEMEHGNPAAVVGELRALTAAYPLREPFAHHLMRALFVTNRRAEALQVFSTVRHTLNRELGIEPCAELNDLQQEVLRSPAMPQRRLPLPRVRSG